MLTSGTYLLSRLLIISTKQISIYVGTFPNALTSKKAQNHEISIYSIALPGYP